MCTQSAGCRAFRPVKPLGLTVIGPSGPIHSTISPLEAGWPKGRPYRCTKAGLQAGLPSGRRAFRLDYKSGPQAGLTQVLAPPVVVIDAVVAVDAVVAKRRHAHAPQAF